MGDEQGLSNCDRCSRRPGTIEAGPSPVFLCEQCYEWWQTAEPADQWLVQLVMALRDVCMLEAHLRVFVGDNPAYREALRRYPVRTKAAITSVFLEDPGPRRRECFKTLVACGRGGH